MPDRHQEWAAAGLVYGSLGATRCRRTDSPPATETHDFEIGVGGRKIALEVTSTTVAEVEGFWAAVRQETWQSDVTRWSWSLSLRPGRRDQPGTRVRRVRRECEPNLIVLENLNIDRFGEVHPVPGDLPEAVQAEKALGVMGVRSGSSSGPPPPGTRPSILIGTAGPGGVLDNRIINVAVEREAAANAPKLARADADERHLFVWVPWSDTEGQAAMSGMYGPPDEPPELPEATQVVWVALWQPGPTVPTSILWRVRPPSGWEVPNIRYCDLQGS